MTFDSAILARSPIGYWKCQETSGTTAADASGNGRNGTYTGGPTLGVPGFVKTVPGDLAAIFTGANPGKYLNVPTTPAIVGATGGSVLFIVKTSGTGTTTKCAYRGSGWRLDAETGTTMKIVVSSTYDTGVASSVLTDNQPHLVVVSAKDVNFARLYIDGAKRYENLSAPPVANSGTSWSFGQNNGFNQGLTGTYERAALFSPALTDADVSAIWAAMSADASVGVLLG